MAGVNRIHAIVRPRWTGAAGKSHFVCPAGTRCSLAIITQQLGRCGIPDPTANRCGCSVFLLLVLLFLLVLFGALLLLLRFLFGGAALLFGGFPFVGGDFLGA